MKSDYRGRRARTYNRQWHTFTECTLVAVLPMLEKAVLFQQRNHHLRILDIGAEQVSCSANSPNAFPLRNSLGLTQAQVCWSRHSML